MYAYRDDSSVFITPMIQRTKIYGISPNFLMAAQSLQYLKSVPPFAEGSLLIIVINLLLYCRDGDSVSYNSAYIRLDSAVSNSAPSISTSQCTTCCDQRARFTGFYGE